MNPIRSTFWLSVGLLSGAAFVFASDARAQKIHFDPAFDGHAFSRSRIEPKISGPSNVVNSLNRVYMSPYFEGNVNSALKRPITLTGGGGALIPIEAQRTMTGTNIAKAGRLAARALGPLAAVSLALYVLELMWDDESQQWTLTQADEFFQPSTVSNPSSGYDTAGEACSAWNINATGNSRPGSGEPWWDCETSHWQTGDLSWSGDVVRRYTTGGSTTSPATDQDIEDAIYDELVSNGVASDLARRVIELGYVPDMGPVQTSGPSSVPGDTSVTTTETGAGTDTTTTTKTYDISYNGDTVTINETTVSTTVHADNSVTTVTNTTTPAPGQEMEPEYALDYSDSPFGEVPELYEQKYPDGLEGVWDTRIAEVQQTPFFQAIGDMTSGAPSSGTCPSWTMNLNFGPYMNFGSFNVEPPCFVWPFVRIALILTAFFVARRLVFGG